ncbi:ABC transporter permease [Corynebacterium comes]|uniref:Thiamine transporter membrane protein n=1 Tax=Corynebacterium comes TaxID=2675218 RepID=A0A6B8VXG3_9CORY|nr:iron ABC transporter permease [Corynebacterium comes]QGU04841.1 thiamine transporter membrane protein [Corynebacterium comes]
MRKPSPALVLTALLAAAAVATPLAFLFRELLDAPPEAVTRALARPGTWVQVANTLKLTLAVTATTLVLGVSTAFAITRLRLGAERLWWLVATLPLAVPSYVAGIAWVDLTPLRGFTGAWLVLVLATTPYVTLPAAAAFRRADRSYEHVARTLGYGPARSFAAMTLPQIAPAAGAGALLVALYCIAEFGVVAIMRYSTLTTAVQQAFSGSFNRSLAVVLSIILVAMALVAVVGERIVRRPVLTTRSGDDANSLIRLPGWLRAVVSAILLVVFAAAVLLPLTAFLLRLGLSVAENEVEWARMIQAAGTTVALGFGGALIATAMALPISVLAARHHGRLVGGLETITFLGHGLPGIAIGLSMVYLALAVAPGLYQTTTLMVIAYGIMFVPKAMGSARSAIAQVPTSYEDVARTLGRGPRQVWAEVTSKIAWPGITAGALIVALTIMKELPATLMMRPIGTDTLATRLWQLTDINAFGAAAPYALLLIAVATIPALALARSPEGHRR